MPPVTLSQNMPDGETIDLTRLDSMPSMSQAGQSQCSQLIDLTISTDEAPTPLEDHMHTLIDIIRPGAIDFTETSVNSRMKRKNKGTVGQSHGNQRSCGSHLEPKEIHSKEETAAAMLSPRQRLQEGAEMEGPPNVSSTLSSVVGQTGRTDSPRLQAPKPSKRPLKPLPFMTFPAEIRNLVYRFLLTTPRTPIELPELTGRNGAAHRAQWKKCTTSYMRRKHKTIFLEILETCKQVHDEASGILYGCNVFKYRSNPEVRSKRVVLPTRHLQLLKHIKISVMTQGRRKDQDEQVADLVRQFIRDSLRLETFEITWWGADRYHLKLGSPMCHALGSLLVEKHFIMKVAGQARMERAMKDELERVLVSNNLSVMVEIHRPVKETGEDLRDEGETVA